jgi:hypothetical protein
MTRIFLPLIMLSLLAGAWPRAAQADPSHHVVRSIHHDRAGRWYNANRSWHAPFAHVQWGRPVALIVPPGVNFQTDYSWGVGRTRMAPINHQFARPYAMPGSSQRLPPHPPWPGDTKQFGVYYVRGPW